MKKTTEDILDTALLELKAGSSKQDVLSRARGSEEDLAEIIEMASILREMPKASVPRPAMRRKYLELHQRASIWRAFLNISNFAGASAAVLLLVTAIGGTAYAATKSFPGQRLFAVKRTAEQVRLHFAGNEVEKASIQVDITKKRLAEAQAVFSNPSGNSRLQAAALQELTTQTQATVEAVKTAAAANSLSEKDHPIVASLTDISQKQQTLLEQISPDEHSKMADNVSSASKEMNEMNEVIQMVAATSDTAILAALDSQPLTASGTPTAISETSIVLEGTEFTLTSQTIFTQGGATVSGEKFTASSSKAITITGRKDEASGKTFAMEVAILPEKPMGAGAAATTTPSLIKTPTTSTSSSVSSPLEPAGTEATTTPEQPIRPQAVGTFIPEDPAPQFK